MEEARKDSTTDGGTKKQSSRSKSSSQLFVPRASVIRHTKDVRDVKLHNLTETSKLFLFESVNHRRDALRVVHSKPEHHHTHHSHHPKPEHHKKNDVEKKEEKDSGIDEAFDDEEEKNSTDDSATSSGNDESSDPSRDTGIESGEEKIDVCTPDSDQDHSLSPSRNFIPNLEGRYPEEPRYPEERYSEERYSGDRYTSEESNSPRVPNFSFSGVTDDTIGPMRPPLLKDPHLAYMLKLYQQSDNSTNSVKDALSRMDANEGSPTKKVKMYLNEHGSNHSRNSHSPPKGLVDFNVAPSHPNKYFPERKAVSPYEPVQHRIATNPLLALSQGATYNNFNGYENPVSSSGNPSVYPSDGKSSAFISDLRTPPPAGPPPPHLFNNSRLAIAPYESNLQCEYCHKKFNNEEAAKRHLLTHKGKRTHKCTHCSRSFYEQASFMRHLKSHSGEKAHKCDQCSMAFSKRSALEVHIRTHTGERPFVCKYCGKGFSISGNLHRHVLIHTGHRPYKCGKCPRAFNNPSHLARHISSFHT